MANEKGPRAHVKNKFVSTYDPYWRQTFVDMVASAPEFTARDLERLHRAVKEAETNAARELRDKATVAGDRVPEGVSFNTAWVRLFWETGEFDARREFFRGQMAFVNGKNIGETMTWETPKGTTGLSVEASLDEAGERLYELDRGGFMPLARTHYLHLPPGGLALNQMHHNAEVDPTPDDETEEHTLRHEAWKKNNRWAANIKWTRSDLWVPYGG